MMRLQLFLLMGLLSSTLVYSQIVNIPDAKFKSYLVGNTSINTNGDTEIQITEANSFTGKIDCANKFISNLAGIEAFVNITQLFCEGNQLTNFNITKNTALTILSCGGTSITSLDISKNLALRTLYCNYNQLTSLDVSKNIELRSLYCNSNQLINLDISKNVNLVGLFCNSNKLTNLNLGNITTLTSIDCRYNQLTNIDVTKNTNLALFNCDNNKLTNLDVSKNTAKLYELYCHNNQLTNLDVSKHTNLKRLVCNNNRLTSLNIKNGVNNYMDKVFTDNNLDLYCIQVDAVALANSYTSSGLWQKDSKASYSTDCLLSVADVDKKQITLHPNPAKDFIILKSEKKENFVYQIFDLSGRMIKAGKGNFNERIEVKNLGKGNYVLQAQSVSGEKFNGNLIKD